MKKRLAITTPTQLAKTKLKEIGKLETAGLVVGPNDVIISPNVIPGIRETKDKNFKNWQTLLTFCAFVEAMILNDNVILEPPSNKIKMIANPVIAMVKAHNIGLENEDLDDVLKIGIGIIDDPAVPDDIGVFFEDTISEEVILLENALKDVPKTEMSKIDIRGASENFVQERIATMFGCSFASGYDSGGLLYQEVCALRTATLQQLTPAYFHKLIADSIKTEVQELRMAGWEGDLIIPPLALRVLRRCRGESVHLGEIILEERRKASRFRGWVNEVRTEFRDAPTVADAARQHRKLQAVFREFAGTDDNESWKVTSWNGLLAALPKSAWDGLSKEDIDVKSLFKFLARRPLEAVLDLIRQRNYLYLLDVRNKVRHIDDYATLAAKVLALPLSAEDLRSLRTMK